MCFLIGVCYVFACMNSIRLLGSILFQFHRTFSFLCGCFKDRWFACVGKPHAETRELQARVDYGYVALKDHTGGANDFQSVWTIWPKHHVQADKKVKGLIRVHGMHPINALANTQITKRSISNMVGGKYKDFNSGNICRTPRTTCISYVHCAHG